MKSHIATVVIEVLEQNHGTVYAAEKADHLRPLETAQVLLWCNNLDDNNQAAVSENLGLSVAEFQTTIQTLRKLLG